MTRFWVWMIFGASAFALAQHPGEQTPKDSNVMVMAVASETTVLACGISCCRKNPPGVVSVEPIAWLTAAGEWKHTICDDPGSSKCENFEKEYLKMPHSYDVVSADGFGATIEVSAKDSPKAETDCYGINAGKGIIHGGSIRATAVAASPVEIFAAGVSAQRLLEHDAEPVRIAFSAAAGKKLDSRDDLRIYRIHLEGQDLYVVQRAIQDFTMEQLHKQGNLPPVFGLGKFEKGKFSPMLAIHVDEGNELILGMIHLKNGRDFLITSINDSESQSFRVYSLRDGKLVVVFEGGGSSC